MSTPCFDQDLCKNSPVHLGEHQSLCNRCRLSPDSGVETRLEFRPVKPGGKHPALVREARDLKLGKLRERQLKRLNKNKDRVHLLARAAKAEKNTEKIIRATKNSGRSRQDGDHVFMDKLTLDTKLQSTRDNPVVLLSELEKVRADAVRARQLAGGLVIRNRHDVGVVVFHEKDFKRLFQQTSEN